MDMQFAYNIGSTAVFGFLAAIWSGKMIFNAAMKMAFTALALTGCVLVAKVLA